MPIPDPPLPSPEEVIVTRGFRRQALAIVERCLPTIIREARYEELEEMMVVFHWFGNREAMQLEAPEDYVKMPGLSLEFRGRMTQFGSSLHDFPAGFLSTPATIRKLISGVRSFSLSTGLTLTPTATPTRAK